MSQEKKKLIKNGKRLDGRSLEQLRDIEIELGVLSEAQGSAYIKWGNNKILVGAYAPREVIPKHLENPNRAIIKCNYTMTTFCSPEEHGRMGPSRRSTELSKVIREALEGIVLLDLFPRSQIEVYAIVLQADAGTRIASFLGAVAALIDAGIPLKDVGVGVAAGKIEGKVAVDLGKDEDNYGEADLPVALTRTGEILLFQMDGQMTKEEIEEALGMIYEKAEDVLEKLREAVKNKYSGEINKKISMRR